MTAIRKIALAVAALLCMVGMVWHAAAQAAPDAAGASGPKFEVASVKPTDPTVRVIGLMLVYPGGRIEARGCTLSYLIMVAYGVQAYQVSGPKWITEDRFSIDAKPPADSPVTKINPSNPKLPPPPEERLMLQSLLAERFHLVIDQATQQDQGLALVFKNHSPNLKEPEDKDAFPVVTYGPSDHPDTPWYFNGINAPMAKLAARLTGIMRTPVFDQTGLTGSYDFKLEFVLDADSTASGPQLSTAIQELGLRLVAAKAPVVHLTVQHAEQPSGN